MSKILVAVLRGGPSAEHEVSLNTGAAVLRAFEGTEFSPVDVIISRKGEWLRNGKVWDPLQILQAVDVVFNALHGTYGEDGTLQRYLDAHGIPYTGSSAYASSLAMNKALTKDHVKELPLKLAPHVYASAESIDDTSLFAEAVTDLFNGPYVIKPVSSGSSVGTRIVNSTDELAAALAELLPVHDKLMVEKRVFGKEATVGIIDEFREQRRYVLPPIEIVPKREFFDFETKYGNDTHETEICPGRFTYDEKKRLGEAAAAVHDTLGLRHYSRSDFIVANDGVYFLEVNTLPGLTEASLLPKALDSVGISYKAFIRHLVMQSLNHAPTHYGR